MEHPNLSWCNHTFSATSCFVPTRGTTVERPSDHVEGWGHLDIIVI